MSQLGRRLRAAEEGQGGVLLLAGEPGIGKTRLLLECADQARGRGWLTLLGRAYDTPGVPPYLPFIEALRAYVRAFPDDERVEVLAEAAPEIAMLLPELGRGLPDRPAHEALNPESERYRLFEAVSDFLLQVARSVEARGLLLCLDDLHWADRATILLFLHLARRLGDQRLLIAGAYRTEEVDPAAPFFEALADLGRERLDTRLSLAPLSLEDTGRFVHSLGLEAAHQATVAEIHLQTRGNPFYVEELVRELQADGAGKGGLADTGWTVPEGIREVIGRRLALLKPEVRRLLQAGAILGDGFQFEIAALMTSVAEPVLMDALDQAIGAGFLRERGEVCHFSHPLVQRTIYDNLSAARRRALHLQAAETIERLYARHLEPHLAALAANYRLAGARADADKTIDYLVRAGEAAVKALAYEQAVVTWEAALELMERHGIGPRERAGLLERLGDLMQIVGLDSYQKGVAQLEQALKLYDEAGAVTEAATVHARLGLLLAAGSPANDNLAALKHLRAAEAVLADAPPSEAQLWLYSGLGLVSVWQLKPEEGLRASARAVGLASELGRHDRWVTNIVMRAYHLHSLGRLREGFDLLEQAWQRADEINQTYPAQVAASWTGNRLLDLLDPSESMAYASREVDQRREVEAPVRRRGILYDIAQALAVAGRLEESGKILAENRILVSPDTALLLGRWNEAEDAWARMRQTAESREHVADRANASIGLARLRSLRGDSSSVDLLLETFSVARAGPSAVLQMRSGPELAIHLAELGRLEEADSVLHYCREIMASGEDWRGRAGRVDLAEAAVAYARSRFDEGEARFKRALAVFRRYALPWDEADAHHLRGRLLAPLGRRYRPQAVESFDAAIETYRRLGADPRWTDRVEAARQRLGAAWRSAARYRDGLTSRQVEILRLVAQGKSSREIAEELVLSIRTVERHIANIYLKTGTHNRVQVAAYARDSGLI